MADNFQISPDKPIFPINSVACELKVHQRTLRIYDEEKILCPKRTSKNRRMYSFNDIKKGEFIIYLTQNMGLNLAGVKVTLELFNKLEIPPDNYRKMMEEIALKCNIDPGKQNKLSKRSGRPKKI